MRQLKIKFEEFEKKCKFHNAHFDYCNYRRGVSEFGCYVYKCPFYHLEVMNEIAVKKAKGTW